MFAARSPDDHPGAWNSRGNEPVSDVRRQRALWWLFIAMSGVSLCAQAFIPLHQFVERADDAYYYFKVAANFPDVGFWSFDRIHVTNGVQPLWGVILTCVAEALSWLGVRDPNVLARAFVGLTALVYLAFGRMLFRLLTLLGSNGLAIVATGAMLFPLGITWEHVAGLENSLYAFMLVSVLLAYYGGALTERGSRGSILLGVLLGLTTLTRLNAGYFTACLLGWNLCYDRRNPLPTRLRATAIAGATAIAVTMPYFLFNLLATGYFLPISGTVKLQETQRLLTEGHVTSRFSWEFLAVLLQQVQGPGLSYVAARAADALWIVGGRLMFDSNLLPFDTVGVCVAGFAVVPLVLGDPTAWCAHLRSSFARLLPLAPLFVFAGLDTLIAIVLYPYEFAYAATYWWLVPDEICIVVLVSNLVVASVSYAGHRWLAVRWHESIIAIVLAILAVAHTEQFLRYYFTDTMHYSPWHLSWNDESLRAARWLDANVPPDSIVGSWNAGVLGYYSQHRVVNLDGLINDVQYLTYLRTGATYKYVLEQRIQYLSDLQPVFASTGIGQHLKLVEIYQHYSTFMRQNYVIYHVVGGS